MKILRICEYCKSEYTATFKIQKYCCHKCSSNAAIKERKRTICRACGKEFTQKRPAYSANYCSQKCSGTAQKGTIKSRHIRKCKRCGADFFATASSKQKYCSGSCGALDRMREVYTRICPICKKQYITTRSDKRKTCSKECGRKHQNRPKSALSLIKTESLTGCSLCGYSKYINILERHHIDRDRGNNNLSNILILCPNCHAEVHLEGRTGRFRFLKKVINE
jgi:hypothetical protein